MSTVSYRAALVREIEQAMRRVDVLQNNEYGQGLVDGQLDAYAHVLTLISDMEDQ